MGSERSDQKDNEKIINESRPDTQEDRLSETSGQDPNIEFLQEEIKKRPLNRKKMMRRMMMTAIMAAVFGAVACLFFLLLEPIFNRVLYPEEAVTGVSYPEETETEELTPEERIVNEEEKAATEEQEKIRSAESTDQVAEILTEAKARLDAVKTDAELTREEEDARELQKAKDSALTKLSLYRAPSEYREAEKALLLEILAEGEAAIDTAETVDAVKALLTEYKGRIDQLKTDEQYEAEEELAQKVKAAAIKKAKAGKTTVSVKALTKHRAKVTWKKVTLSYTVDGKKYTQAVSGYKIYRAAKKNGKYRLIKTIKKAGTLKYTDKKLKKGRKYYYKVRTYTKIDGKSYFGKWSKVKKITAK